MVAGLSQARSNKTISFSVFQSIPYGRRESKVVSNCNCSFRRKVYININPIKRLTENFTRYNLIAIDIKFDVNVKNKENKNL